MKKIILAVSVLFLSMDAFAQGGFEWGIKAGVNLSNVTNIESSKSRTGFNVGIFGECVINDFVGIQAELLYSMQGYKFRKLGNSSQTSAKFDYVNLPILAKLYVMDGLSIDLGPQIGYLVKKDRGEYLLSGSDNVPANKFDLSFAMGASYRIAYGIEMFARYNLGLTEINKSGNDKLKNRIIQVGAGYRF